MAFGLWAGHAPLGLQEAAPDPLDLWAEFGAGLLGGPGGILRDDMTVNATIAEILPTKAPEVWTIQAEATVYDAIELMAEKNIGALLVMEGDRLLGLVSERDYTRKVHLLGRKSRETKVREITSTPPISVTPAHTVEECMRLMTEKRVRHLPVLEGERVVGIVSIGDLVNWIITAQNATIQQLQTYISGQPPG